MVKIAVDGVSFAVVAFGVLVGCGIAVGLLIALLQAPSRIKEWKRGRAQKNFSK